MSQSDSLLLAFGLLAAVVLVAVLGCGKRHEKALESDATITARGSSQVGDVDMSEGLYSSPHAL